MGNQVRLLHSTHRSRLAQVLEAGIKAVSSYADLGLEMRRGVVYCWLRQEDDKLSGGGQRSDHVYVEVTVAEDRCIVSDMDLYSAASMYGGGPGATVHNPTASRLLAEAYRATAVPLSQYAAGMFYTPEVLVRGDIAPDCIRLPADRSDPAD